MSIQKKLIITFCSLAILPLLVVGFILAYQSFQLQTEQAMLSEQETVRKIELEMGSFITGAQDKLQIIIHVRGLSDLKQEERLTVLKELLSYENDFEELVQVNEKGLEEERVHRFKLIQKGDLISRVNENVFEKPASSGKVYFGDVRFNEDTGEPYMYIAVPFFDLVKKEIKGVLIADLRLKKIWHILASIPVLSGEQIYIINSQGRVIAHPNPSIVLRKTTFNPPLAETGRGLGLNGNEVIYNQHDIQFGDQVFTIIAERDINEAFAPAYDTMSVVAVFLAFTLLVAVTMLLYILKKTISPIKELAFVAREIEAGNLNKEANIHGKDEVGELSEAFNRMTKNLRNSLEDLENEVDIRKKAENTANDLQALLRDIVDSMPSVLIGVNDQLNITHWNTAAARITGISRVGALGQFLGSVYPDAPFELYVVNQTIQTAIPYIGEKTGYVINDEHQYFNINIYPLKGEAGEGAVIRIDDVTELERKDQQLRQAQKMDTIGTLASGLAHDFNNVLSGITGPVSVLESRFKKNGIIEGEKTEIFLKTIHESAERATGMVKQLLTLTRKQTLNVDRVDLNTVIERVMRLCENSLDKRVKLSTEYSEEPAWVFADAAQLEQVFLNVSINASHAMTIMRPEGVNWGGKLNVTLEKMIVDKVFRNYHPEAEQDLYWKVSFIDNGIGMNKDTIGKIFTPFFSTKETGSGTGLGLAMVYNIIKQHHGFIDVYSEPGEGSQFSIFLPLEAPNQVSLTTKTHPEKLLQGNGIILVIDDEQILRETARGILQECQYTILTAASGKEGLEILKQKSSEVRLILLDMTMPEMSGKETFIEIRKINKDVPILMASGFKQDERVEEVIKLGASGFIEKPFTLERLGEAVFKGINQTLETKSP